MLDEYAGIHGKAFEPGTREALASTAAWLGRVAKPGRATLSKPAKGERAVIATVQPTPRQLALIAEDLVNEGFTRTPEAGPARAAVAAWLGGLAKRESRATEGQRAGLCVVCLEPGCERDDCAWVPFPGETVDFATALGDMQRRPAARYLNEEDIENGYELHCAWAWVDGKLMCAADHPKAFEDCNEPGANERMQWTRVDVPPRPISHGGKLGTGAHDDVDIHDLTEVLLAVGKHAARCAWAEASDNGGEAPSVPNALAWDMLAGAIGLAIAGDPEQDESQRMSMIGARERAIFEGAYKAELSRLPSFPYRTEKPDDLTNRYTVSPAQLTRHGREAANDAWCAYKGEAARVPAYPEPEAWERLQTRLELPEGRTLTVDEQRVYVEAYRGELKALTTSAEIWKRGGR